MEKGAGCMHPCVSCTHSASEIPYLHTLSSCTDSLKEKEALRRAHLRGLAATLRCSPEARSAAAQLAAPLGKLALEGCAKAAGTQ